MIALLVSSVLLVSASSYKHFKEPTQSQLLNTCMAIGQLPREICECQIDLIYKDVKGNFKNFKEITPKMIRKMEDLCVPKGSI